MQNTISIVGSGHTKFGRLDNNLEALIVAATREAVEEAGLVHALETLAELLEEIGHFLDVEPLLQQNDRGTRVIFRYLD